jgi:trigger factor
MGDVVVLDFNGTVDGEALPGMAGEDHHLELGANQFIPGFEEQIAGLEAGDSRDVVVTFPADYGSAELAGREAKFACTIKEIMEQATPEIDEAFAQSLGVDDLETLRGRIRGDIGREYERLARDRMKREMLDMLAEAHDFAVPPSMESAEFDAIWKQIEADRERGVVDPEDAGKDEEALREEYRGIAVRRVRLGLLLAEVGRINEVEVQQDEVNNALQREASRFPGQEQQVFQFYQNNPQALAQLRAPIFEDKVVDFIAELAEVTEREVSADDLRAEEEATQGERQKPAKKTAKKTKSADKKADKKTVKKADSKKAAGKAPKKTAKSKKADEAAAEES